jgi:hypothetical protein
VQYSCISLLEDGTHKIAPPYRELASAIEATTHRLPTTGIIVPPPAELNQALAAVEETMNGILEAVGPQLDTVLSLVRACKLMCVLL